MTTLMLILEYLMSREHRRRKRISFMMSYTAFGSRAPLRRIIRT